MAARICGGLDGVRACVVLSSDGLTLGSYPEAGEERAREAWGRLQQTVDPQRGFLDTGEEVWAMVRRGPYIGMVITGPGAKPGLLLDKLDALLRTAEEDRARGATEMAAQSGRAEVPRRPRTSLHGDQKRESRSEPRPARARPAVARQDPAVQGPGAGAPERRPAPEGPRYSAPEVLRGAAKRVVDVTAEAPEPASGAADRGDEASSGDDPSPGPGAETGGRPPPPKPQRTYDDSEIDRVALAREFGRLLSESGEGG